MKKGINVGLTNSCAIGNVIVKDINGDEINAKMKISLTFSNVCL